MILTQEMYDNIKNHQDLDEHGDLGKDEFYFGAEEDGIVISCPTGAVLFFAIDEEIELSEGDKKYEYLTDQFIEILKHFNII